MNEITRIHIAKIPYEIDVNAKKKLETYSKQLERAINDREVMLDIETRMAELLAERGVTKNDVISQEDVEALRAQLGEPHEFTNDTEVVSVASSHRLYRDTDTAVLGGVLGGLAKYIGINPLWTRLVFTVLLFVSFGTALIVYLVLWIVLPAARTAADKLSLEGRPVTVTTMKEMYDDNISTQGSSIAPIVQRWLLALIGLVAAVAATGALVVTLWAGGVLLTGAVPQLNGDIVPTTWSVWLSYVLFIASGILLTLLGGIIAYSCFSRRVSKRIGMSVLVVIVAGVMTFGTGVGALLYGRWQMDTQIDAMRTTTDVTLPADFANMKKLSASGHSARNGQGGYADFTIEYVVSTDKPHYRLEALPDNKPDIRITGDSARVVLKTSSLQNAGNGRAAPRLVIYGPALNEVRAEQGNVIYTSKYGTSQPKLHVIADAATSITVHGAYDELLSTGQGTVEAGDSTVYSLVVNSDIGQVQAGVVRTLSTTQPGACPANDYGSQQWQVTVRGVTSGVMTYNDQERPAGTYRAPCGSVIVGEEE